MRFTRREFLAASAGSLLTLPTMANAQPSTGVSGMYKISLAEWSVHRMLAAKTGETLTNLEFPQFAKEKCGIDAVEYVSRLFEKKEKEAGYIAELNSRCNDAGVRNVLIMVGSESGDLGDPDEARRHQAVEEHRRWLDIAKTLGCKSIRVYARSKGTPQEQQKLAADGISRLTEYAVPYRMNVLIENHGGLSSNAEWLVGLLNRVGTPFCGSLPDFGNFKISPTETYDNYQGVRMLMPYAKGVSAKSYDFNEKGDETTLDYYKLLGIVVAAGYNGYVGIEYEGKRMGELEGILATKALLEKCRRELSPRSSN